MATKRSAAASQQRMASRLPRMQEGEARRHAMRLKDKWEHIVTDAFKYGYLTTELCAGCGKYQCGSCPCGTSTGWMPGLDEAASDV